MASWIGGYGNAELYRVRRWVMNTGEMQLWDGKLGYAISAADSTGPACVVEHILLQLTQEKMAK